MNIIDRSAYKLGARPHVHDARVLPMARYVSSLALQWPSARDHAAPMRAYPMRLNDSIGDCVIVALINWIVTNHWLATGEIIEFDDAVALAVYVRESGYNGTDPNTDVGCVPSQAFGDFAAGRFEGLGLKGHTPRVALSCNDLILPAIYFFGATPLQLALPRSAQSQQIWDVPLGQPLTGDFEPGSWGQHEVLAVSYDEAGNIDVITWAERLRMTMRFASVYVLQATAIVSDEMLRADGKSFEGFDVDALVTDARRIGAME